MSRPPLSTGDMLDLLATFGRPRVSRMDDGLWHASVDLPAPTGVTVKVASDFNHPSHESALTQLLARVGELKHVGDKVKEAFAKLGPSAEIITIDRKASA